MGSNQLEGRRCATLAGDGIRRDGPSCVTAGGRNLVRSPERTFIAGGGGPVVRRRALTVLLGLIVSSIAPSVRAAESVRISQVDGRPALLVDGRPTPPHMHFNTSWNPRVVADDLAQSFAEADIHLHQFDVNLDWNADYGRVDLEDVGGRYRSVDERISAIVGIDAEALILLRVHLNPPVAWGAEHPDQVLTAEDGTKITYSKWSAAVSYASELWRAEAGNRLATLIDHLQGSGLERHVLGYLLFAGWSGEWNFFRQEKGDLPGARYAQLANMATDHSPAMQRAFRTFLDSKYRTNAALHRAWARDDEGLEDARVPTETEVYDALPDQINDPRLCSRVSDYFACASQQVSTSLLHFASVAKGKSPDRITGAFYGEYLFAAIGGNRELLRTGHGDFQRVVTSRNVDFLVTPNCYQSRGLGGHSPSMTLTGSAQRHGKLIWYEYDQPTHLGKRDDAPRDMAETRALMRRAFAYCLCEDLGIWWWDQESRCTDAVEGGVWYRDPDVRREFAEYQRLWRRSLGRDRSSVAEIAVIYDPASCLYQRPTWDDLTRDLIYGQVDALGKLGAPYNLFCVSDLEKLDGYKLYVVWNACYLTDRQLERLRRLARRPGVTMVWWYAPGCLGPNGLDVRRMSSLVGMGLERIGDAGAAQARPVSAADAGQLLGRDAGFSPLFAVTGADRPLVRYELPGGPVAVGVVERDGWRSVYMGTAPVPAEFLRQIVRMAGVHQYVERDDVVYANASYVAIHAVSPGMRVIRLPRRRTVTDAFTGQVVARESDRFPVSIAGPETRLFELQ